MSQALQEVLRAESEARNLLQEANQRASEIVEDARKEARLTISRATDSAREEAGKLLEDALKQAEEEKQRALTHARTQMPSPEDFPPEKREEAVNLIVKVIAWNEPG